MRNLRCVALLSLGLLGVGRPAVHGESPSKAADDQTVHLIFAVPDTAEVWIEGTRTIMSGPVRHFVSPAIKPGQNYVYTVRVRWQRNGQSVDETRTLTVRA